MCNIPRKVAPERLVVLSVMTTPDETRSRGYKKKERTRGQLVDAGLRVLAEKGEAFTIADVVAEAGMSSGTFYNYFDDRDALFDALASEMAAEASDEIHLDVEAADPALQMALARAAGLARAAEDKTWGVVMLRMAARSDDVRAIVNRHVPDLVNHGYSIGRFNTPCDEAILDLLSAMVWVNFSRVVSGRATNEYIVGSIAVQMCALGVERSEAVDLAERAVAEAGLVTKSAKP